jgi:hypothetical protein
VKEMKLMQKINLDFKMKEVKSAKKDAYLQTKLANG